MGRRGALTVLPGARRNGRRAPIVCGWTAVGAGAARALGASRPNFPGAFLGCGRDVSAEGGAGRRESGHYLVGSPPPTCLPKPARSPPDPRRCRSSHLYAPSLRVRGAGCMNSSERGRSLCTFPYSLGKVRVRRWIWFLSAKLWHPLGTRFAPLSQESARGGWAEETFLRVPGL